MRLRWTRQALDDIAALTQLQRRALQKRLEALAFVGQGLPCASPRYSGAWVYKHEHWLVMYLPLSAGEIAIVAVEYNLGQRV